MCTQQQNRKIIRKSVNISRLKLYVLRDDDQAKRVAKKTRVTKIMYGNQKYIKKLSAEEKMHARNMWRKPEENH